MDGGLQRRSVRLKTRTNAFTPRPRRRDGVNGAIAVDPSGKDTSNVYAVNNVPSGSEYSVSGVTYSYPSGKVVGSTGSQMSGQESAGIAMR